MKTCHTCKHFVSSIHGNGCDEPQEHYEDCKLELWEEASDPSETASQCSSYESYDWEKHYKDLDNQEFEAYQESQNTEDEYKLWLTKLNLHNSLVDILARN